MTDCRFLPGYLLLTGVSAVGLLPATALAQSETGASGRLEEIIVTAQKREQSALDVPITMTVFDPEFLAAQGIDNIDRLSDFIPGVRIDEQSVNNPAINVRGITTDDGSAATQPRVSVYQDGVDISRPRGASIAVFDVERIEVLKGPQSTLLGRGAMVGAINFISARPEPGTSGSFSAEVGDFDQRKVEGMINTPIIDDVLLFRAAAQYRARDGFVENITGTAASQNPNATLKGSDLQGIDSFAARALTTWMPTEDFAATLIVNYQLDDQPGTAFKNIVVPPTGGDTSPFTFAEMDAGRELGIDRELWSVTLDATYDFSDRLSLTSITSWRTFDSVELFDADGFQSRFLEFIEDADSEQFSQEFRLNYSSGGSLTGFLGANFFYEDGSQRVVFATDEGDFANLLVGTPFVLPDGSVNTLPGFPEDLFIEEQTIFGENTTVDVFADASWQVTDRLELTGGLRVSVSDVDSALVVPAGSPNRVPTFPNSFVLPLFTVGPDAPGFQEMSDTFTGLTGRAVARYAVTDDLNVYLGYARGRRPEVIDEQDATDTLQAFKEETVDSIEGGLKSTWLGGRLTADVAGFYYKFNNFRTTIDNPDTQDLDAFTSDEGEASTLGFELDARFQATPWLFLFATYGFLDAEISDDPKFGPVDTAGFVAGDTFRISPDHSLAAGITLTAPVGYGLEVFLKPTYTWQSETFFGDDNQAQGGVNRQESFGLLDIRGGVQLVDGSLRLAGFVENATDTNFIIDSGNTGGAFGLPTQIPGAPRMFGLEISGRF